MKTTSFLMIFMVVFTFSAMRSSAAVDLHEFNNEVQKETYVTLTQELRCPKCQNQNLADSDSEIAEIMRDVIAEELLSGKTSREIKASMVERYGDFVLYKPPVTAQTLILWWSPGILFAIAVFVFFLVVRSRFKAANKEREEIVEER